MGSLPAAILVAGCWLLETAWMGLRVRQLETELRFARAIRVIMMTLTPMHWLKLPGSESRIDFGTGHLVVAVGVGHLNVIPHSCRGFVRGYCAILILVDFGKALVPKCRARFGSLIIRDNAVPIDVNFLFHFCRCSLPSFCELIPRH